MVLKYKMKYDDYYEILKNQRRNILISIVLAVMLIMKILRNKVTKSN